MAVSVSAEALAGPVIGEVPGSLGGVRALADTRRSAARTVTWRADACREAARSLGRDLESTSSRLLAGAHVMGV